jgi:cytochrome c
METNKLVAAILTAITVAALCGFVAKAIVHVPVPTENAYKIEVSEDTAGGAPVAQAVAEPILALLASADVAKGQSVAKVCAACHTFDKGGPSRVGPNLYNIVGAMHAHSEGFAYSDAMKALKDKPWTYSELNGYLWNPKKHMPGTKMGFAGLKKPEDRAAVIAYLRTLADSPAALPSEADIAAEAPKPAEAEAPAEGEAKVDEKPADAPKDVKAEDKPEAVADDKKAETKPEAKAEEKSDKKE